MEADTSKAQLEVWEWKDKAGKELSKIPLSEQIAYIKQKTAPIIAKLKIKKAILQPVVS